MRWGQTALQKLQRTGCLAKGRTVIASLCVMPYVVLVHRCNTFDDVFGGWVVGRQRVLVNAESLLQHRQGIVKLFEMQEIARVNF